jgi:hypothetical protein
MFIHPNLQGARPLMVVGGPRCGTRFVASALNRHPEILVQGEIPSPAMDNAVRFLSETGDYFASQPQWSAGWERSRRDLLYAIWASMIKRRTRVTDATITWFGHKTPRHDQYWEFYRNFFSDLGPKYVFCMRNFADHYLSLSSMQEGQSIDRVAGEYRASVSRYAKMKAALGENVSLFVLDDLHDGGIDYIRERLFDRLGIEVDDRTLSRIDIARKANSTEAKGRERRRELTADERGFLEENPDLMEALQALRAARSIGPGQADEGDRLHLASKVQKSFKGLAQSLRRTGLWGGALSSALANLKFQSRSRD